MQTQKHDAHIWAYIKDEQAAYRADFEWEQWLDSPEYNDARERQVQQAVCPEHY